MAASSEGRIDEKNIDFELKCPEFFRSETSNLCIQTLGNDKILVGSETGVFITNLDPTINKVQHLKQFNSKEIPSICTEYDDSDVFYVACQKHIQKFDLRCSLDKEVFLFNENSDEINQISVNNCGLLAACDDSGECKIYDTKKSLLYRTLRNKHKNICSTAAFFPTRQNDIVTGGLDSQIIAWNHATIRFTQIINTQDLLQKLGDNSVNMFNPPMVNSLKVSADGKILASGLGNGSLQIFNVMRGKTVLAPSFLINHHSSLGITSVDFVDGKNQDSCHVISGGNDAEVNIWNIPSSAPTEKKRQIIPENKVVANEEDISRFCIKRFKLETKVNAVHTMQTENNKTFVLVADQTPKIKCYDITQMYDLN